MRPGEKLYEEVSSINENTVPTEHEKIRIFTGNGISEQEMLKSLDRLREICHNRDIGGLVMALKELVPDYSPSAQLLKRALDARERQAIPAVAASN